MNYERRALAIIFGGSTLLGAAFSAYMYFLRAPSVVAARPQLPDLDFWTALFSGRFEAWLWHHDPAVALVVTMAFFWVLGVLVWWTA